MCLREPGYRWATAPTDSAFNFLTSPEDREGNLDTNTSVLISERITVDRSGNSFSGTGKLVFVAGTNPLTGRPLIETNFTITAKRVTVDVSQLPPP